MKSLLVLGTGQLGLMLAAAGARLGIQVDRLDVDKYAPLEKQAAQPTQAQPTHAQPTQEQPPIAELLPGTAANTRLAITSTDALLSAYDCITAEKEHLPTSPLVQSLQQAPAWAHAAAFQQLPNRALQKQQLEALNIATAAWHPINSSADVATAIEKLGQQLVIKSTQGGYDGKGQWRLPEADIAEFAPHYGQLIAEQWVDFTREVSLIGVRTRQGECRFLPLNHNHHTQGMLRYSISGHSQPHPLQATAEQWLQRLMQALEYVGVMTMECFITADQQLLVNEVAPRVHNSGHWSISGAHWSQFDWHISSLLDLPIPIDNPLHPTLMLNLIGCAFNSHWTSLPGVKCHWYGKSQRPGRKLGHLNLPLTADWQNSVACLLPHLDDQHQQQLNHAAQACRSRSASAV